MRRLKIMSDDVPMACGDVLGINDMLDRLKAFCLEQGIEVPMTRLIEVDGVLMPYAVPLRLLRNDQMGQIDAEVVFLLTDFPDKENREAEARRLKVMVEDFGRPCLWKKRPKVLLYHIFCVSLHSLISRETTGRKKRSDYGKKRVERDTEVRGDSLRRV